MFEVLKPFSYSTDGVTSVRFAVGDPAEINDDLSKGLSDEGFIKDLNSKEPKNNEPKKAK